MEKTTSEIEKNRLIKELKIHILELRDKIKELENVQFNIKPGKKLFIETLTYRGEVRTYQGILVQEGKKHLKIKIENSHNNKHYHYIIAKSLIGGLKIFGDFEK